MKEFLSNCWEKLLRKRRVIGIAICTMILLGIVVTAILFLIEIHKVDESGYYGQLKAEYINGLVKINNRQEVLELPDIKEVRFDKEDGKTVLIVEEEQLWCVDYGITIIAKYELLEEGELKCIDIQSENDSPFGLSMATTTIALVAIGVYICTIKKIVKKTVIEE